MTLKAFHYYLGAPTPGQIAEWVACGKGKNTGVHQLKVSHNSSAQAVRFEASVCSRTKGIRHHCSFYTSKKIDL